RRRHTRWPRDWSSDVCSSDLAAGPGPEERLDGGKRTRRVAGLVGAVQREKHLVVGAAEALELQHLAADGDRPRPHTEVVADAHRSEEHTSELQSRGHLVCRLL